MISHDASFLQGFENLLSDSSLMDSSLDWPRASLVPWSGAFPAAAAPSAALNSDSSLASAAGVRGAFDLSFTNLPPPNSAGMLSASSVSSPKSGNLFRSPLITSPPKFSPNDQASNTWQSSGHFPGLAPALEPHSSQRARWSSRSARYLEARPEENPIVNSLIGAAAFCERERLIGSEAKQWTHRELVSTILKDVEITIQWLMDRRLLIGARNCPRCGPLVRLEMARCQRTRQWQTYDEIIWVCRNCDKSTYLRQSSFFDRPFNVSIITYVELIYWWARCMPIDQMAEQTRTKPNFVTLMMCLLREICAFEVGERHLIKGGPGAEIQLNSQRGHFSLNKVSCEDYLVSLESAEAKWRLKFGFNAFECILVHMSYMYRNEMRRAN